MKWKKIPHLPKLQLQKEINSVCSKSYNFIKNWVKLRQQMAYDKEITIQLYVYMKQINVNKTNKQKL